MTNKSKADAPDYDQLDFDIHVMKTFVAPKIVDVLIRQSTTLVEYIRQSTKILRYIKNPEENITTDWMDKIDRDLIDCANEHNKPRSEIERIATQHLRGINLKRIEDQLIAKQLSGQPILNLQQEMQNLVTKAARQLGEAIAVKLDDELGIYFDDLKLDGQPFAQATFGIRPIELCIGYRHKSDRLHRISVQSKLITELRRPHVIIPTSEIHDLFENMIHTKHLLHVSKKESHTLVSAHFANKG